MQRQLAGAFRAARSYKLVLIAACAVLSALAGITTSQAGARDVLAPTAPYNLSAQAGDRKVDLKWGASTDETGIKGYRVYRNGSQVAAVGGSTLSFSDTSLTNGTTYKYVVKAYDRRNNLSPASNEVSATPTAGSSDGGGGGDTAVLLSKNQPVTVSSTEDQTMLGAQAVDGNAFTRWGSANGHDPEWMYVDLGASASISHVKLTWEAAFATAYKIQTSNDAQTWTDIYSTTTGDGGVDDLTGLNGTGRYVRVYGTARATQWGYSLYELEVYGTGGATLRSQCSDTLDNDGDGQKDYPADPDCTDGSDNNETGTASSGVDSSGQSMPVGNIPGWTQIWADNFPYNVSQGNFPAGTNGKWSAYPDGWHDTSGNGTYNCTKVCSVHNGMLDMFIHSENGTHYVAVPYPKLSPWGNTYGRYAVRFTADPLPRYKTAWLLWPDSNTWPRDGEIDFPEGNLDQNICAYMHHQGGTSGGDQDAFCSQTRYTGWHTAVTEWTPSYVKFYLDGALLGTSTSRIPNTPMHWVLQTETQVSSTAPDNATQGHVYVDWAAVYRPA
jgi:hypothetical protein